MRLRLDSNLPAGAAGLALPDRRRNGPLGGGQGATRSERPWGLTPQRSKRLKLPTAHRQQQGKPLTVLVAQFLVALVLLRKILGHTLHAFQERRRQAAADGAVHQQQAFAIAVKAA